MTTVPEILVDRAWEEGVRHFFGLPSSGVLLHVLEAGRRRGVEFVSTAHESSAVIAAAYNGYFSGSAGLAIGIQGPGAGNMVSGAVNVKFERKPVVCVCECPAAGDFGNWGQQADHPGLFKSTAGACLRIKPQAAAQTVHDAFRIASGTRLGPVLLELPRNLGTSVADPDVVAVATPGLPEPAPDKVEALCNAVASFQRPVIIAGDDVRQEGLTTALVELADTLQAVVLVTMDGRGVFPEMHPRFGCVYIGTAPPHTLYRSFLEEADGVLVIGADGRMKEARWDSDVPVCELVTGPQFAALSDTPQWRVDGRLTPTVERLSRRQNREGFPISRIAELRAAAAPRFARPPAAQFAVQDVIAITREQLPVDGLLFAETGVFQSMLEHLWPVVVPDTFFGSTVGRTMGLTIPALLGAKLACPLRPMVGFTTDGSALMRLGELEVFSRAGVVAPLIVMNDGALGTIHAQQRFQGLPDYGLQLQRVDFASIARTLGLNGVVVETPEEYAAALRQSWDAPSATVIDCRIDPQAYRDSFMPTTGMRPSMDSSESSG